MIVCASVALRRGTDRVAIGLRRPRMLESVAKRGDERERA
jgi:hypothetical protein